MLPRPVFALCALLAAASALLAAPEAAPDPLPDGLYAEFTTPRGVFTARLDYEKTPLTCASFVGRAEGTLAPRDGKPFFTGLRWYRVVPGFVLQSGDPLNPGGGIQDRKPPTPEEDAAGHPLPFPDEIVPGLHHDAAGVLSMANGGPDTNSSEFFVTLRDTNRLNYLHSVFGRVVRGLAVLPLIRQDDALGIRILRIGPAAQAFAADAATFAALAARARPYAATPTAQPEPGPTAHFDDPDRLLPQDVPRARNFNFKLANFERFTGRRIVARLFAKSPTAAEDSQPGAYMRALATKLGTARTGVLVVYFADEKDWRVWFGDEAVAPILGHPPTAADLATDGPLHAAKMAFIDAALAQGDADFAAQQKAAPADRPPPPAQHLKLQVDALLDALIFRYEPSARP